MNNQENHIGIIGEGKMGTNIFHYLADLGFPITLVSSTEADTEKLNRSFQKKLKRSLEAGILDEAGFDFRVKNICISDNPEDLAACNLIIEAVTEDLLVKQQIFTKIDSIVGPGCIFASNSSSINPSRLIPSESRKDKFIGIHFFYPVSLKNIVELIIPSSTSQETIAYARQFLQQIRRNFLLLNEENSFILNRIFLSFQNEAFLMVTEGKASIRQMDEIIKLHFFPFGAFDFMDSVGIPTMLASIINYTRNYPDKANYEPLISRLQMMAGTSKFYLPDDPGTTNPGEVHTDEITTRLTKTLSDSMDLFAKKSGLPPLEISTSLNEYFGVDLNGISGLREC